MRREFVTRYAERDEHGKVTEMQRWPEVPPKGYKNMTKYKQELAAFVLSIIPEKYSHPKKTASQIMHFATRIRLVNNLIWNIMRKLQQEGQKKALLLLSPPRAK